eukprot:CAMPEP_0180656402 /NCGR_PEP_ID=MMETSP1037_2-20121125/55835_1 /TAXON_ID=632150 /ORGANISM="Azadinium spinosum, Strain 3D9" /LENGTH=48 /DNA_ID= /DNA_START= /DNA_END= /DNA_ORIENTATION=
MSAVMQSPDWAVHVAGDAELLNEVLAHIAGMNPEAVSAPGPAKRQRCE